MASTPRDENRVPALFGVSPIDGTTAIPVYIDDSTHELYVKLGTSTGVSTATNQTTLNTLTETLQETTQRLSALASVVANNATLKVSGAVTATGGGYVTSAQVIAALLTQTNSLRLTLENTLPVLANVNNCTGA